MVKILTVSNTFSIKDTYYLPLSYRWHTFIAIFWVSLLKFGFTIYIVKFCHNTIRVGVRAVVFRSKINVF